MAQVKQLGLLQMSAIREITNIGLGHAITALNTMTQRPFNMSVPSAQSVALTQIPELLGSEETYVGICMQVDGDVPGYMAFLFPWASASELWAAMLGSAPESPESVSEYEASALIEVGNIINSSFLNAISLMTSFEMHSTPPSLAIDMSISILESVVTEASLDDHVALAIETDIFDSETHSGGMFVFIPTLEGLESLFRALGISEAA